MAKLTKAEAKLHEEAVERLAQPTLSDDDKEFIRAHWQEGAAHLNTSSGAFFTPWDHALDFALEFSGGYDGLRILDLCAGMGNLSAAAWMRQTYARHDGAKPHELVCVELDPTYIEVGKTLLPEATWIQASVFDLPELGHFDVVISNPPFGRLKRDGDAPRYKGAEFDYHVIDIAADLGDLGVFIVPSGSAPFSYSGSPYGYQERPNAKYAAFKRATGIELHPGLGVDTTVYREQWHGVAPATEHVIAYFADEWREGRE